MKKVNPTETVSWKKLKQIVLENEIPSIRQLFENDKNRFENFSLEKDDLLFDYSKNKIDAATLELLVELAMECDVEAWRNAMFEGKIINETENRPVLHVALRNVEKEFYADGELVTPKIKAVLSRMAVFSKKIYDGEHKGFTNKKINTIVNIGIGGSDLGSVMVTEALKPYWIEGMQPFFVSNIDGTHISEVLKKCNPETTLFIIASKTFTTQETMENAETAKKWFLKSAIDPEFIKKHFVALSTNSIGVTYFGIDAENMFEFWDWVGGRYSLWSAIGFPIMLTIGFENFKELLNGAQVADNHFMDSPMKENIPILMALIGIWNCSFLGAKSEAILPYDQYLHRFAAYFQQGNMESNGKNVDRNGHHVTYETGPIIWGEPGTNGQHAFYQLIHQGSQIIPCDFIAPANSHNPIGEHHQMLLSNFFAQTQALAFGKNLQEITLELKKKGIDDDMIKKNARYRVFEGDRPSNSFLMKRITPKSLGMLIALYEHKIFTQGIIWNIFSFDQWGVEFGKQLANKILPTIKANQPLNDEAEFDSSTIGLLNQYFSYKE